MPSRSLSVEATLAVGEPATVDTTLDADEPASVVATLDAVESTVAAGTECEEESTCGGVDAVSDGVPLSRNCALGIAGNAARSSGAGALSEPAAPEPAACVRSAVPAPESDLLCGPSPPIAARAFKFLPAAAAGTLGAIALQSMPVIPQVPSHSHQEPLSAQAGTAAVRSLQVTWT